MQYIHFIYASGLSDLVNIKVLNAGAWSRSSERVPVTLPRELEDFIPEVEQFYRTRHQGRKLHWHHILSNGVVRYTCTSYFSVCTYVTCLLLITREDYNSHSPDAYKAFVWENEFSSDILHPTIYEALT